MSYYEETSKEEEFIAEQEYLSALDKVEHIKYNKKGNKECSSCSSEEFITCDIFGNRLEEESDTVRCCNCGQVYYI